MQHPQSAGWVPGARAGIAAVVLRAAPLDHPPCSALFPEPQRGIIITSITHSWCPRPPEPPKRGCRTLLRVKLNLLPVADAQRCTQKQDEAWGAEAGASQGEGVESPLLTIPLVPLIPCQQQGWRLAPASTQVGTLGTLSPSEGISPMAMSRVRVQVWFATPVGPKLRVPVGCAPLTRPGTQPSAWHTFPAPLQHDAASGLRQLPAGTVWGQLPAHGLAWHPPHPHPLPGSWLTQHVAAGAKEDAGQPWHCHLPWHPHQPWQCRQPWLCHCCQLWEAGSKTFWVALGTSLLPWSMSQPPFWGVWGVLSCVLPPGTLVASAEEWCQCCHPGEGPQVNQRCPLPGHRGQRGHHPGAKGPQTPSSSHRTHPYPQPQPMGASQAGSEGRQVAVGLPWAAAGVS